MKKWFKGIYKHVIAVAVLIVYVFSANSLYVRFILKDGKPLGTPVTLPAPSKDITFVLDNLVQPLRINGQDLNDLHGYAFFQANKDQENTITIILSSKAGNLAFPTRTVDKPNMIESLPGLRQANGPR